MKSKKMPNEHCSFSTYDPCRAYEYMGCHKIGESYVFRVAAPNACRVCLTGDFDNWSDPREMKRISPDGIYEIEICADSIPVGSRYKYRIQSGASEVFKADPYAQARELCGLGASVVSDDIRYEWHDRGWMQRRTFDAREQRASLGLNIYEIPAGAFNSHDDMSPYTFSRIASELSPYLKQMGYTHVLFSPLSDGFFESSDRQAVPAFYAPCERYGGSAELLKLTDIFHSAGIGVMFRLNMSCFPKDEYGLCMFDGGYMYERDGDGCEEYAMFDLAKREVREYLISNAMYFADVFHADGFVIDDVSDMFSGKDGNAASDLLCELSRAMRRDHPDALMISDGMYDMTLCNGNVFDIFDMHYDARMIEDAFECIDMCKKQSASDDCFDSVINDIAEQGKIQRLLSVHDITCRLHELSLDEWNRYALKRMLIGSVMALPCGKHTLMGDEICCTENATYIPSDAVDWSVLDNDMNARFQLYCSDINNFFLAHTSLGGPFVSCKGWTVEGDHQNVRSLTFVRGDAERLYVTANFSNTPIEDHRMYVECVGTYTELFNSDDVKYGGSGVVNKNARLVAHDANGDGPYIRLRLPPMAVMIVGRTDMR